MMICLSWNRDVSDNKLKGDVPYQLPPNLKHLWVSGMLNLLFPLCFAWAAYDVNLKLCHMYSVSSKWSIPSEV